MTEIVCEDRSEGHTPVRDGDKYCSPRCGWGCKWVDYLRACDDGRRLCALLGRGWTYHVWENSMRWHTKVSRGRATIYIQPDYNNTRQGRAEYACYFNTEVTQFVRDALDPLEALNLSLTAAREAITQLTRNIAAVECEDLEPMVALPIPAASRRERAATGRRAINPGRTR